MRLTLWLALDKGIPGIRCFCKRSWISQVRCLSPEFLASQKPVLRTQGLVRNALKLGNLWLFYQHQGFKDKSHWASVEGFPGRPCLALQLCQAKARDGWPWGPSKNGPWVLRGTTRGQAGSGRDTSWKQSPVGLWLWCLWATAEKRGLRRAHVLSANADDTGDDGDDDEREN